MSIKKTWGLVAVMLMAFVLVVGCSTEMEDVPSNVKEKDKASDTASKEEGKDENAGEEKKDDGVVEVNKEIADDENFKASLKKVRKVKDSIFGNSVDIIFEVENKTDRELVVQSRGLSVDGKMVDETIQTMSQDVLPGKRADAILTLHEFEGYEFPELKESLEMTLYVVDWNDFEFELEYPVTIEFE